MIPDEEIEYFASRESMERAAADAAACVEARDAHFQLAERYADRCWSLSEALFADAS